MEIPQRLGRLLVVLALIVALLCSSIPVPARAATLTGTVAAGTAIAAGLVALGIGVGATETTFNNLVDSLTAVAGSDRVPVWISETADGFVTYLQESFLGSLLAHCFDTGVLVSDNVPPLNYHPGDTLVWPGRYSDSTINVSKDAYVFVVKDYLGVTGYGVICAYWQGNQYLGPTGSLSGTSMSGNSLGVPGYFAISDDRQLSTLPSLPVYPYVYYSSTYELVAHIISGDIAPVDSVFSTSEDLTLGSVGASMSAPNYDPWRTDAIPVVPPVVGGGTADEDDALPVTFPGLDTPSITGQTQAGAQSGITPGTVVDDILSGGEVVPETGTISDVITAVRALGADIVAAVQAIPAAIADVFSPPAISDEYMISLSDFFPFCLPFDIYDLLSALAADPQAPVFEWTIAVPRWGISHDIEVDLSEWDDIARLFRTFELGAFVLGLALITRQKFLRS